MRLRHLLTLLSLLISAPLLSAADVKQAFAVERPSRPGIAPEFTLLDLAGTRHKQSSYQGKLILLHFWATWCGPCRVEMPTLQSLADRYSDQGLLVVSVSADKGSAKQIQRYLENHDLDILVLRDQEGDVREKYDVIGLPTTYLLGRDNTIKARMIGPREWDSPLAHAFIEEHLFGADSRRTLR